jgi:hypothetical protein
MQLSTQSKFYLLKIRANSDNGFTLTDLWGYEFTPFFDGVPEKKFEDHDDYDMCTMAGKSQYTVTVKTSSRIDQTFGKSWSLRYVLYMVTELHQPMHNIIRFSNQHPDGDDFGRLEKINILGYSTLFDLFEDAFGQYRDLKYPLSSTITLDKYVDQLMADYPASQYQKQISDETKSNWSKESYNIGKNLAYQYAQ